MGKGSNTQSTSQSQSTSYGQPTVDAYNRIMGNVSGLAGTTWNSATAQQAAGLSTPQQQAVDAVSGGIASPYIAQAAQYAQTGASALTDADIQNYMNPWTQNVIDATQHDFDVQNQRTQSGLIGNARIGGALGGDREAVVALLGQEAADRVQNPIIQQLRSQGYQTALGAAQQDKARQGQAANTLGGLSTTNINSMLGIGQVAQGTQQNQYNATTANAQAQASYPFQLEQYLAGITASAAPYGGTTTTGNSVTQGPTPNTWSQLAGMGLAGAAVASKIPGLNSGGRVPGYAGGGGIATPFSGGYIPQMQFQAQPLASAPMNMAQPQMPADGGFGSHMNDIKSMTQGFKGIIDGGKKAGAWARTSMGPESVSGSGDAIPGFATTVNPEGMGGWGNYLSGMMPEASGLGAMGGLGSGLGGGMMSAGLEGLGGMAGGLSAGLSGMGAGLGSALAFLASGGAVKGYARGGRNDDDGGDDGSGGVVSDLVNEYGPDVGDHVADMEGGFGNAGLAFPILAPVAPSAPSAPIAGDGIAVPVRDIAQRQTAGTDYATTAGWEPTVTHEPAPSMLGGPAPSAGIGIPAPITKAASGFLDRINPANWDDNTRAGVLQAGLGMMASAADSPGGPGSFLGNIGKGGLKGAQAYQELDKGAKHRAMEQQHIDQAAKELQMRADREALATLKAPYDIAHVSKQNELIDQQILEGKKKPIPIGYDMNGKPNAYAIWEPATGKLTPVGGMGSAAAGTSDLAGDEYLAALSPSERAEVKKVGTYRGAPIGGQRGLEFMSKVSRAYPGYDATKYPKRQKIINDFSPAGQTGKGITAGRTALDHAAMLEPLIDRLGNWDTMGGVMNPIHDKWARATGDKEYLDAVGSFNAQKAHLATELDKAMKGSGQTTVSGIQEQLHNLDTARTPTEMKAALRGSIRFLGERLKETERAYEEGMDMDAGSFKALGPESQAIFDRIVGSKPHGEAASQTAPQRPANVPGGSLYSPSRKMWKSPDGAMFDENGARVQ